MLAVPVSLIATFAAFPLFGFSVNTLSLFGLVLAIGLVVHDAIVVVEGIQHHTRFARARVTRFIFEVSQSVPPTDLDRQIKYQFPPFASC